MADSTEIFGKIQGLIAEALGVDAAEVTMEAAFVEDLGADSLDIVELVMELEKEFDIEISDDDAEQIATVGDAVNYISQRG